MNSAVRFKLQTAGYASSDAFNRLCIKKKRQNLHVLAAEGTPYQDGPIRHLHNTYLASELRKLLEGKDAT